jgi:hypothetical protein
MNFASNWNRDHCIPDRELRGRTIHPTQSRYSSPTASNPAASNIDATSASGRPTTLK